MINNSTMIRFRTMPGGEDQSLPFDLSTKRSWCSKHTGNPEGIPALEDPSARLSHPELRRQRPLCFSPNQWHDWVTSCIEHNDGENPDGYCLYCLPKFQREQKVWGTCAHANVYFEDTGPELDGVVGRRRFWMKKV